MNLGTLAVALLFAALVGTAAFFGARALTAFPSSGSVSWVPVYGKIASETHTLASQMPGTSSDKEHYTNSVLKVAGNWVAFDGYYDNPNYFSHLLILDTQSADVYDNCS